MTTMLTCQQTFCNATVEDWLRQGILIEEDDGFGHPIYVYLCRKHYDEQFEPSWGNTT